MLQFVCDSCRRVKLPEEIWINGMAVENVGTQAARREVVVDPAWRRDRAVQPFAVHFCSIECKDRFLTELFNKPPAVLEVRETTAIPGTGVRVVRAGKKILPMKVSRKRSVVTRRRKA
jgi:hypothetical protein